MHTLVGQQTKDYYNMPDIGVCVVGGVDAFENEISENWVDYFTKVRVTKATLIYELLQTCLSMQGMTMMKIISNLKM